MTAAMIVLMTDEREGRSNIGGGDGGGYVRLGQSSARKQDQVSLVTDLIKVSAMDEKVVIKCISCEMMRNFFLSRVGFFGESIQSSRN